MMPDVDELVEDSSTESEQTSLEGIAMLDNMLNVLPAATSSRKGEKNMRRLDKMSKDADLFTILVVTPDQLKLMGPALNRRSIVRSLVRGSFKVLEKQCYMVQLRLNSAVDVNGHRYKSKIELLRKILTENLEEIQRSVDGDPMAKFPIADQRALKIEIIDQIFKKTSIDPTEMMSSSHNMTSTDVADHYKPKAWLDDFTDCSPGRPTLVICLQKPFFPESLSAVANFFMEESVDLIGKLLPKIISDYTSLPGDNAIVTSTFVDTIDPATTGI